LKIAKSKKTGKRISDDLFFTQGPTRREEFKSNPNGDGNQSLQQLPHSRPSQIVGVKLSSLESISPDFTKFWPGIFSATSYSVLDGK